MKATLKNYRQSPHKVRLIARLLRGKEVSRALDLLRMIDKKAGEPLHKLLVSAMSNAKQSGKKTDDLTVTSVVVNEGLMAKRYRPRAFGRSTLIRRRTSTIHIELQ